MISLKIAFTAKTPHCFDLYQGFLFITFMFDLYLAYLLFEWDRPCSEHCVQEYLWLLMVLLCSFRMGCWFCILGLFCQLSERSCWPSTVKKKLWTRVHSDFITRAKLLKHYPMQKWFVFPVLVTLCFKSKIKNSIVSINLYYKFQDCDEIFTLNTVW